jgi:hypothetical protein
MAQAEAARRKVRLVMMLPKKCVRAQLRAEACSLPDEFAWKRSPVNATLQYFDWL